MATATTMDVSPAAKNSIKNYRKAGIDIEIMDEETIKITQARLLNGYILSNKQLYERAREVFPDKNIKITPVVYSLNVDDIDMSYVKNNMEEFGIHRNDLIG